MCECMVCGKTFRCNSTTHVVFRTCEEHEDREEPGNMSNSW